jgi:hypothetical protein
MARADRYEPLRRRYDLANRMIGFNARTITVAHWTGLSEYRIQHFDRRYLRGEEPARHGSRPKTSRYFARSPIIEAESLTFILVAIESGVIPEGVTDDPHHALPGLERGERLMDAFDSYRTLVQSPQLTLERAILLLFEFAQRGRLALRRCYRCSELMLTERSARNIRCPFCRNDFLPEPVGHGTPLDSFKSPGSEEKV